MRSPRNLSLVPLLAALLAAGCGNGVPDTATSASSQDVVLGTHVHKMPVRDAAAPAPAAAPAGAHLTYYGGRVVSSIQVVQVLYGSGTYIPEVAGTVSPNVATFYGGVTASPYFDWLTEYNTNITANGGGAGTNQAIARGGFVSRIQITPSAANNGSTIDDTQIQSELAAQINAGHLPVPTTDAAGNTNTYYAIFFPSGKTITQGGSSSCVAGGFCAYHGTIANVGGHEVYYGVHPHMGSGSGCATGCGNSPTTFQNQCSVASHEMIETVTDPEVGLASVVAKPVAWYDSVNGEIGDICNAQQGTVVGSDGVTYTVQTEFDNATSNCIVQKAAPTNNFSISASPSSVSVVAGNAASSTISTATTSGSAQTVSLSVSGAPAGVTATLSPTSVTSGGSSTLSISTATTTAAGTYTLTVTGTAASGSHTTAVTLPVTAAGGGGGCTVSSQLFANPGFESGATGWTATAGVIDASTSGSAPRTGTVKAWLDGYGTTHTDTLFQTVTIPSTACSATLTFWLKITTAETTTTTAFDKLTVTVRNTSNTVLSTLGTFSNL
ncbi:MAG TPA: hypothetical protein VFL36_02985, partial [Myxococcales bacterium]|nr:hypothetical protein [Myxococcales bacterium]